MLFGIAERVLLDSNSVLTTGIGVKAYSGRGDTVDLWIGFVKVLRFYRRGESALRSRFSFLFFVFLFFMSFFASPPLGGLSRIRFGVGRAGLVARLRRKAGGRQRSGVMWRSLMVCWWCSAGWGCVRCDRYDVRPVTEIWEVFGHRSRTAIGQ